MDSFDERAAPASPKPKTRLWRLPDGPDLAQLRSLISLAESHRDQYDAYHLSAKVPSLMTLNELRRWIKSTPKLHKEIGATRSSRPRWND